MNREEIQRFVNAVSERGLKWASMEIGVSYVTAKRLKKTYENVKPEKVLHDIEVKDMSWFREYKGSRIFVYVDGERQESTVYLNTYKLCERLFGYQEDGFRYDVK